jgi:hypothetical protein
MTPAWQVALDFDLKRLSDRLFKLSLRPLYLAGHLGRVYRGRHETITAEA